MTNVSNIIHKISCGIISTFCKRVQQFFQLNKQFFWLLFNGSSLKGLSIIILGKSQKWVLIASYKSEEHVFVDLQVLFIAECYMLI